jgi:tetratricopeptide (TPR) repeat protein
LESNELKDRGQIAGARKRLEKLVRQDIRRIGELSLGEKFEGVFPWGTIDNRPFVRCLKGLGLCFWRLERYEEAENVLERLLWISPSDNLGVRFLLPRVRVRFGTLGQRMDTWERCGAE